MDSLPVEYELWETGELERRASASKEFKDGLRLFAVEALKRTVLVLTGNDADGLERLIGRILGMLPLDNGMPEPDLNLIGKFDGERFGIHIIPRRKHRPSCYYAAGDHCILVSPGAADMGGLVVVTREEDLEKLDISTVESIYGEVGYALDRLFASSSIKDIFD